MVKYTIFLFLCTVLASGNDVQPTTYAYSIRRVHHPRAHPWHRSSWLASSYPYETSSTTLVSAIGSSVTTSGSSTQEYSSSQSSGTASPTSLASSSSSLASSASSGSTLSTPTSSITTSLTTASFTPTSSITTSFTNASFTPTSSMTTSFTNASSTTTSSSQLPSSGLLNVANGSNFVIDLSFGASIFTLLVDTGSSDTWVASSSFPANFTPNGDYLDVSYTDGTYAIGPLGTDTVNLAGVTIPNQIVAIANETNAISSAYQGILGLSFSDLTRPFSGPVPPVGTAPNSAPAPSFHYSSIMNTTFEEGLSPPVFSLALSRDILTNDYGGVFVVGGLPDFTDPRINVTGPLATTPITTPQQRYIIAVDSITYGNEVLDRDTEFQVDSGTSFLFAPIQSVYDFYAQFVPAVSSTGTVPCNAQVPPFAVNIAGQAFSVNVQDYLLNIDNTTCSLAIVPTPSGGINTLGDVFLMNVLAVFDWRNQTISFGSRVHYNDDLEYLVELEEVLAIEEAIALENGGG